MLYITTRNKVDSYTAHHTLLFDRNSDGGAFIPMTLPKFSAKDVNALQSKSFGQCVADVLNLFFSSRLDGWDIDFCIGRYPIKLISMSHKIIVAETWHNPDNDFARLVRNLSGRILGIEDTNGKPTSWAWIAVRIAVLFGLFGELVQSGYLRPEQKLDVAVAQGDFSVPMAVWYAREMGLPIGTIICSSNESCTIWDLIHHGELRMDLLTNRENLSKLPQGMPAELERLIFATLGPEEVLYFQHACDTDKAYTIQAEKCIRLSQGMSFAVVSRRRMESVINNVYSTNTYLLEPDAALAYGGLQDYRARAGETRGCLILAERSPIGSSNIVAKAAGITPQELAERTRFL